MLKIPAPPTTLMPGSPQPNWARLAKCFKMTVRPEIAPVDLQLSKKEYVD
jgi:hypothetical protein